MPLSDNTNTRQVSATDKVVLSLACTWSYISVTNPKTVELSQQVSNIPRDKVTFTNLMRDSPAEHHTRVADSREDYGTFLHLIGISSSIPHRMPQTLHTLAASHKSCQQRWTRATIMGKVTFAAKCTAKCSSRPLPRHPGAVCPEILHVPESSRSWLFCKHIIYCENEAESLEFLRQIAWEKSMYVSTFYVLCKPGWSWCPLL